MRRKINGAIARFAASAILAMVLGIASTGECTAQRATIENQPSIPAVERPTTLEAVLRNIKYALDRGLFLREDFYQDEVLRQYFGGNRTRQSSGPFGIEDSVSEFGDMVEPLIVSGHPVPGMSFSIQRQNGPNGFAAAIDLNTPGKTAVDFDVVEKIFGRGWRPAEPRLPSPHENYVRPTRPHGNAEIVYSASDGATSWQATLYFKANAELSLARISTKAKR
jgi:hypothetical protein